MASAIRNLLLVLSLISPQVNAQFFVSIKSGIAINDGSVRIGSESIRNSILNEQAIGFFVGLSGNIKIDDKFSFAPEFQFIQKGENYYFELVSLFAFSPLNRFNVQAGPSVGLRIYSPSEDIRFFDVGANIGISYAIGSRLYVSLRGSHGIVPVIYIKDWYNRNHWNDPGVDPALAEKVSMKMFNRSIQLSISYKLKKAEK